VRELGESLQKLTFPANRANWESRDTFAVRMAKTRREQRLIGYARISTYGQTLDNQHLIRTRTAEGRTRAKAQGLASFISARPIAACSGKALSALAVRRNAAPPTPVTCAPSTARTRMLALSRLPICLIPSLLPQHARPTCQCCVNWSEVRTAVNDDSEMVSWHLERSLAIFDVSS